MKKFIKKFFILIIILIILITFSGCSSSNNNLATKLNEELKYLDLEIISLINYINNITIENYKISTKEITLRRFYFK